MPERLTDSDLDLIRLVVRDEINPVKTAMASMKTTLIGEDGQEEGGLCGRVQYLAQDHSTLKRQFWILVSFLVGSGVITVSVFSALGAF